MEVCKAACTSIDYKNNFIYVKEKMVQFFSFLSTSVRNSNYFNKKEENTDTVNDSVSEWTKKELNKNQEFNNSNELLNKNQNDNKLKNKLIENNTQNNQNNS